MAKYQGSQLTYMIALEIVEEDNSFYALIQAAMRQADSENQVRLRYVFPQVWEDLEKRKSAPMGYLPGEAVRLDDRVYFGGRAIA